MFEAMDGNINDDGNNVHLTYHSPPYFTKQSAANLTNVARHGFSTYKEPGELLASTSLIAAESYSKEFVPGLPVRFQ
jgi:hypothetical protein